MNNKVPILVAVVMIAGCGTPARTPVAIRQPDLSNYFEFWREPPSHMPQARLCLLGTSCLDMDSRPFEVCLLGGTSCSDKLAEVMQVERPARVLVLPAPR